MMTLLVRAAHATHTQKVASKQASVQNTSHARRLFRVAKVGVITTDCPSEPSGGESTLMKTTGMGISLAHAPLVGLEPRGYSPRRQALKKVVPEVYVECNHVQFRESNVPLHREEDRRVEWPRLGQLDSFELMSGTLWEDPSRTTYVISGGE